jgi:hypothetical protein
MPSCLQNIVDKLVGRCHDLQDLLKVHKESKNLPQIRTGWPTVSVLTHITASPVRLYDASNRIWPVVTVTPSPPACKAII